MFSTPEFWVFSAFILFLAAFGKRAFVFLTRALDAHSHKIALQIEEAQRLHDEALSLLESYKKKHGEALDQAEHIISFAEKEALAFKKSSEQEFERFMAQKEKYYLERIALEREEAQFKLRQQISEEALKIVEHFLSTEEKEKKTFTKASLKEIETVKLGQAHYG